MPDHVHLVMTPMPDPSGATHGIGEIIGSLKGASAHGVNRALNRKGPVWQEEWFDHVLRSSESVFDKVDYILENPVRAGLVESPDRYPWSWREHSTIEGLIPEKQGGWRE